MRMQDLATWEEIPITADLWAQSMLYGSDDGTSDGLPHPPGARTVAELCYPCGPGIVLHLVWQNDCFFHQSERRHILPFDLSLSTKVFVCCIEAAATPLRYQGIHLAIYLLDWLLLAQPKQKTKAHMFVLLCHLWDLGFVIDGEKSRLSPVSTWFFWV